MKDLGTPLLREAYLTKQLNALPPKIAEASAGIVLYQRGLTEDELRSQLQAMFCLTPLILGTLQTIKVDVARTRTMPDTRLPGYIAEGRLPYTGSQLLWRVNPGSDLRFPYSGVAAETSVGWRKLIPSLDIGPFKEELQEVRARTAEAFQAFAPTVRSFDDALRAAIDRTVRSWL